MQKCLKKMSLTFKKKWKESNLSMITVGFISLTQNKSENSSIKVDKRARQ